MTLGWGGGVGGIGVKSGKAHISGITILKDVWMEWIVSKRGFSSWLGWCSKGTVSEICCCVGSYGFSVVILLGWSDGVSLDWDWNYERSVFVICGVSDTMVLDTMVSDGLDCSGCLTVLGIYVVVGSNGCFCLGLDMVPKGTYPKGIWVGFGGEYEVESTILS